jgi:hypothetical protein
MRGLSLALSALVLPAAPGFAPAPCAGAEPLVLGDGNHHERERR